MALGPCRLLPKELGQRLTAQGSERHRLCDVGFLSTGGMGDPGERCGCYRVSIFYETMVSKLPSAFWAVGG